MYAHVSVFEIEMGCHVYIDRKNPPPRGGFPIYYVA